jgi:large subunit ribosomal protein L28
MARVCEFCAKKTRFGNKVTRRGLPKSKGGVGMKTTGISRRRFKPNIQRVRAQLPGGAVRRVKICTKCIRSGRIRKPA